MRCVLVAVLVFAGCGGRSQPVVDGSAADRKLPPDQPSIQFPDLPQRIVDAARPVLRPPGAVVCKPDSSDCRDEVVSQLILPVTDPQKYGLQVKGKTYNALGAVLGALSSLMGDLQGSVDAAVNSGTTLLLLRLQAALRQEQCTSFVRLWRVS